MNQIDLPPADVMYAALLRRDREYEGVFFVAVRTTGIFCRPSCPARKPRRENVDFYGSARDALAAGFRPCRRCRPLEALGAAPDWMNRLLEEVEADLSRPWTDKVLRGRGVQPEKLRRWFKQHHGMTFQGYLRSRRLAVAMGQIQLGRSVTGAALETGYQSPSGFRDAFERWCGKLPADSRQAGPPVLVNRLLTPLGPMVAAGNDEGLWLLEFADRRMLATQFARLARRSPGPLAIGEHPVLAEVQRQLEQYFDGGRTRFELPLLLRGTEFQVQVWNSLLEIEYGQTLSYDQLARNMGRPGAQRAVGRANGDNRLAILVPCHRVIRHDGTLSGYGGGVWRKRWLLGHEQSAARQSAASRRLVPATV